MAEAIREKIEDKIEMGSLNLEGKRFVSLIGTGL